MTTTTKARTRKPAPKPARRVSISHPVNGVYALHMTIGTGEKAKHFGYYLSPIPADFGLGFHVEKFGVEQVEGEDTQYDVNIDTQRGYHSCTCKGNTYHGHCKHVEATLALIAAGKLETSRVEKPAAVPVMVNAEEPMARVLLGGERHRQQMAAPQQPWCEHCGDNPAVYCPHCSI